MALFLRYRYKQGPLVLIDTDQPSVETVKELNAIGARGIVYALPPSDTYAVETPSVSERISRLVATFKGTEIQVILDVTANYVSKEDPLFQKAIESADAEARSAFIFTSSDKVVPTNWKSLVNGSAWENYRDKEFVLRQFGDDLYDIQMNSTVAKTRFKAVLKHLVSLGVKGVRLANAPHFIINADQLRDEQDSPAKPGAVFDQYDYYTHTQTTNQPGLSALMAELADVIKNATLGDGFLSVTEPLERFELFRPVGVAPGIELPILGLLPHTLASAEENTARQLHKELKQINNGTEFWSQWVYDETALATGMVGLSEYNMFVWLLPGVPVGNVDKFQAKVGNGTAVDNNIGDLQSMRKSASYQHGSFAAHIDANNTVVAYSR